MTPQTRAITITDRYFPSHMVGTVDNVKMSFPRIARRRVRRKRPIRPSEWLERHYVLVKSARPGNWKNSTVPYLPGIIDASLLKYVRGTVICASPQSGKSEAVTAANCYCIDRAPGDIISTYPDKITSEENARDRIKLAIRASRRLSSYATGYEDDFSTTRINLQHMTWYFAWSNSPARQANKPCRYANMDEVDKNARTAGKRETSSIQLTLKRLTTYDELGLSKWWMTSTPTVEDAPIWEYLTVHAEVIFDFHVICQECGASQKMAFENIRVPDGERDPGRIESRKLAYYVCAKCGEKWDDIMRNRAVRAGQWRERKSGREMFAYLEAFKPGVIGFHLPAWYSPFVSLSKIMASWFKANPPGKRVDKTLLKDFMNNFAAEPWVIREKERKESAILALCEDRPMGRVPGDGQVACLTFGADTQDDGFWFKITAHGFGLARDQWVIRCGFVTTLEALAQVLWSDAYEDAGGHPYLVRFGLIDAMGHRTGEVYDWCRQHPGRVLPTKGEKTMNQPFSYTRIEYYPGTKKPIPGALQLVRVNTKYFKDQFAAALTVQAGDPGSIRMPEDLPMDYARHYTSEFINEKGDWDCMPNQPNHLWDCGVLNACAAELIQVRFWKKAQLAKSENVNEPAQRTGGWINGGGSSAGGNWLKR